MSLGSKLRLSLIVGASFTFSLPAFAQEQGAQQQTAQDQTAQAQSAQAGGMLEEIVVTAQKRSESIADVPISINVLSGDKLDAYKLVEMRDLSHYVPNLQVGKSAASDGISIRGVGSGAGSLNFEQSVAIFVDGVYGGRSHQFQAPFFDLERIEVMRGPQGGLAGKNTTAGAVNVVTRKPTDVFEGELSGSYEFELDGKEVTGIISGPLTDKFKARVAARYEDTDGWVFNPVTGNDEPQAERFIVRGTGVLDSTDTFSLTGKLEYSSVKEDGCFYETKGPTDPLELTRINGCNGFNRNNDRERDYTDSYNATLTADWQVGDHTITSITAYSAFDWFKMTDGDFSALDLTGSHFTEDFKQFSEEVRLLSPTGGTLEYVAGLYFHDNEQITTRTTFFNVGTQNGAAIRAYDQDTSTISAFGQATINFSEDFSAKGSLRYTHENKKGVMNRDVIPVVAATNLTTDLTGEREEDQWDPGASLQYDINDEIMLFLSYAHGSKGGGFVGDSPTVTLANWRFEPESAYSFEGGFKYNSEIARLFVTLFRTRYKNQQVTVLQPNTTIFVTQNVGVSQSKGVEVEAAITPIEGLTISGSGAYLQAKYTFYPNGPCLFPRDTIVGCVQDRSGTLFDVPQWTGSLSADYNTPINDTLDLVMGLGMYYQSETFRFGNPRCNQDAYAKFDARLGVESESGWHATLRGRNIFDKATYTGCPATPLRTGFLTYNTEPPRRVALEVGLKF